MKNNIDIMIGTWGTDGWAIFSPLSKTIRYDTFRSTRKDSILAAGCDNFKKWKKLYSLGFRVIKVSAEWEYPN